MCDLNWNTIWTAVSAIATVGATIAGIFAGLFAYKNFKLLQTQTKEIRDKENEKENRKEKKRKALEEFFNSKKYPHLGINEQTELKVLNISKKTNASITENENNDYKEKLMFYDFNNLFCNEIEELKINGISIPVGFNLYKVLNDNTIRLDLINDNNGDIFSG